MSAKTMATDWASDVKRYVPDADDGVIAAIVRHCGIALRTRDASMVSFSDKAETDRVREKFCRKKLALTEPDEVLDAAIAQVGKRMSDTKFRNRVAVYYLLAEHFGKLGLFVPKGSAKSTPIVALAAVPEPTVEPAPAPAPEPVVAAPEIVPFAAAAMGAASAAAAAPLAAAAIPAGVRGVYQLRPIVLRPLRVAPGAADDAGVAGASDDGFIGLAAAIFAGAAVIMIFAAIAGSYVGGRFDAAAPTPPPAAAAVVAPVVPAPAPAPPEGAGVTSEVVEGRPKVSVFFDVGKAEVAPGFTAAIAPVLAWLDANPADRVQLSGFTDPSGNAAANAELAKLRAQAVAAALAEQGVAAERMDLVKPEDSNDGAAEVSAARRVEITVTGG